MSEVIKLIRNTDMYFQYETSSTPTTEDELQAYLKNTHAVVENLTDAYLWQPSTAYAVGQSLKQPICQPEHTLSVLPLVLQVQMNLHGIRLQQLLMMALVFGNWSRLLIR